MVTVGDAYNNRVQQFTRRGAYVRKWGGPLGFGIPGPFKQWFHVATGTAVDSAGNVYVADFYNDRIQKFSSSGEYITAFGISGTATGEMDRPTDMATGPEGLVYVVDFGNHRIQVFQK